MDDQQNGFVENTLTAIDELFANEIGPVAPILAEETCEQWLAEIAREGRQPRLRTLLVYISMLAEHIDDEKNRQQFLNAAHSIDAFIIYRCVHHL
ncbi:MAG: hypothetical protein V3W44_06595 [Dehalococcoidales bacterium]